MCLSTGPEKGLKKVQFNKVIRYIHDFLNSYKLLEILVIGALIGKQKGRNIEIMNSFELVFSVIGGDIIIDRDYYNMKEEQCKC